MLLLYVLFSFGYRHNHPNALINYIIMMTWLTDHRTTSVSGVPDGPGLLDVSVVPVVPVSLPN